MYNISQYNTIQPKCKILKQSSPHHDLHINYDFDNIQQVTNSDNGEIRWKIKHKQTIKSKEISVPPIPYDFTGLDKELREKVNLKIHSMHSHRIHIQQGQNGIGVNTSVTNDKESILLYQDINPYPINGVDKADPAITSTGKGYVLWRTNSGESLLVPIFYCEQSDGTILSPQSI